MYQSHGGTSGISDSETKLARLSFPRRMSGRTFLDIGCNEGFFCNAAVSQGATSAVGIDKDERAIQHARTEYGRPNVEFIVGGWDNLPPGPFDVILWASAMHYERDPASVIAQVKSRLSPRGLFILECGVIWEINKEYIPVRRPTDVRWYPTQRLLLEELLAGFSVRSVAEPACAQWDDVPRSVFHCRPGLPNVLLMRGTSGSGKSTLAARLSDSATKIISLDRFLERLLGEGSAADGGPVLAYDQFRQAIGEQYRRTDLTHTYDAIDELGLTPIYIDLLTETISSRDQVIIIDGYLTDLQARMLTQKLSWRAIVWDVSRRSYEQ